VACVELKCPTPFWSVQGRPWAFQWVGPSRNKPYLHMRAGHYCQAQLSMFVTGACCCAPPHCCWLCRHTVAVAAAATRLLLCRRHRGVRVWCVDVHPHVACARAHQQVCVCVRVCVCACVRVCVFGDGGGVSHTPSREGVPLLRQPHAQQRNSPIKSRASPPPQTPCLSRPPTASRRTHAGRGCTPACTSCCRFSGATSTPPPLCRHLPTCSGSQRTCVRAVQVQRS
jgi:hypothetical protein